MILRIDRWGTEMPPPSDPDPKGARDVQELMGGRFGEMSTLMNYTFQSFNFRDRQGARPFYDLIANIAAEEFGHIELVAAAINTMLTGSSPSEGAPDPSATPLAALKGVGNPHHYIAGGLGALRLPRQSVDGRRRPIQALPLAADPHREDPRVPAAHRAGPASQALPLLARGLPRARRRVQRAAPGDGRGARGRRRGP